MSRLCCSLFACVLGVLIISCSDSTNPGDDGSLVTVELPDLSVPLLAASDDRLFTLRGDSISRALDGRSLNGDVRWTFAVPGCTSGLECFLAVDGSSNLYFNTTDGLMSRSGSNGALRWTATSIQAPAIAVGTAGRLFAPGRPFTPVQLMHAIDAVSGTVTWSSILPPGFDATAVLLDESRSRVYAIGRGGAVSFDTQTGSIQWITSRNCFAGSDGALATDGTIYVTCDRDFSSELFSYDPSGNEKWRVSLGSTTPTMSPLLDAAGTIYVSNRGSVTALNPAGGVVWRKTGLFRNLTHPVVDLDRNVYIAASRISSISGRNLLLINNGAIAADRGLLACSGSMLLNEAGRLYCGEVGLLVYLKTPGNDPDAQWNQVSHDANRTARR